MKTIYEIAENKICKECRENKKEKYPNSIDCAFRAIDGEYCDELENLMKIIYGKKCNNRYVESKTCKECSYKEDCRKGF